MQEQQFSQQFFSFNFFFFPFLSLPFFRLWGSEGYTRLQTPKGTAVGSQERNGLAGVPFP